MPIFEYGKTALRYTQAVREYIRTYHAILRKFADLHLERNKRIASWLGERISPDPSLVLNFEQLVLLQKTVFEEHFHKLLCEFLRADRRKAYVTLATTTFDSYIRPKLLPIRNFIVHPVGAYDYLTPGSWEIARTTDRIRLSIPLSETLDIGAFSERDLAKVGAELIDQSFDVLDRIVVLLVSEIEARYGEIGAHEIFFSKYLRGITPNTITHTNLDLAKLDHNIFELAFT